MSITKTMNKQTQISQKVSKHQECDKHQEHDE